MKNIEIRVNQSDARESLINEYRLMAKACDELLLRQIDNLGIVAIDTLHIINQSPVFADRYRFLYLAKDNPFSIITRIVSYLGRNVTKLFLSAFIRSQKSRLESDKCDVIIVSHLLENNTPNTKSDFYFGSLHSDLAEQGLRVKTVLLDHTTVRKLSSWGKAPKLPEGMFPIARFMSLSVETGILLRSIRTSLTLFLLGFLEPRNSLSRRVAISSAIEALSPTTLQAHRLHIYLYDACLESKPHNIFVTWEGHAWERIALHAARSAVPTIRCLCYQHGALHEFSHSLIRSLGEKYDPDVILTTGVGLSRELAERMNFNKTQVIVYGSHRIPVKVSTHSMVRETSKCIILPQGEVEEIIFMMDFAIEAAKLASDVNFVIRLHPLVDVKKLFTKYRRFSNLPSNLQLSSEKSLVKDFSSCAWAVYRGSITCCQAIFAGLKAIYLIKQGTLSIDPLYLLTEWKCNASNPADLIAIIAADKLLNTNARNLEWKKGYDFVDQKICPASLENISDCLA